MRGWVRRRGKGGRGSDAVGGQLYPSIRALLYIKHLFDDGEMRRNYLQGEYSLTNLRKLRI